MAVDSEDLFIERSFPEFLQIQVRGLKSYLIILIKEPQQESQHPGWPGRCNWENCKARRKTTLEKHLLDINQLNSMIRHVRENKSALWSNWLRNRADLSKSSIPCKVMWKPIFKKYVETIRVNFGLNAEFRGVVYKWVMNVNFRSNIRILAY